MERLSISIVTTGFDYAEVIVGGFERSTGATTVPIQRRAVMGAEDIHLAAQAAMEVVLGRMMELHEDGEAERSLGAGL